jgi:hypothetical protein
MAFETPPAKPVAMTTAELMGALRAHYIKPVAASARFQGQTDSDLLVEEVCAPGSGRRCDLLRIGMWASRGHRIIVHELKVSRADFLKELEDPAKAEAWWPYCHEFWIVAPDRLIDPGELPDGWGLMVPPPDSRRRKFKVVKQAASKDPQVTPLLMVEIARRVDNARLAEIAQLNSEHRSQLYGAVAAEKHRRVERSIPQDVRDRLDLLDRLEAALGTRVAGSGWTSDGVLKRVSPEQTAAAFADYFTAHVSLQEIAEDLFRQAANLSRAGARLGEQTARSTAALERFAPEAVRRDSQRLGGAA